MNIVLWYGCSREGRRRRRRGAPPPRTTEACVPRPYTRDRVRLHPSGVRPPQEYGSRVAAAEMRTALRLFVWLSTAATVAGHSALISPMPRNAVGERSHISLLPPTQS